MNKYTITKNNLHIVDSCQVSKKNFGRTLTSIKNFHPKSDVWKRSDKSLKREWAVHNFSYSLGLFRSRTKDVDLNYPNRWAWLYNIVGALVWIFIK